MEPGLNHSFRLHKSDTNRGEKEKQNLNVPLKIYVHFIFL